MITQTNFMRRGAALATVFSTALAFGGLAHGSSTAISDPSKADAAKTSQSDAAAPEIAPSGNAATPAPANPAPAVQAPVPPPLSAEALAMRSALEVKLGKKAPALQGYATRQFQPLWLDENGQASDNARLLVDVLSRAADHALPVAKYRGAELSRRLAAGGPALEADLTSAFLTYAADVGSGLLEPRRVDRELHIFPEGPDEAFLIERAGRASDMAAFLEALAPSNPLYKRLVERYAAFRSIAGSDIWGARISKGRTLRPGNQNQRVAEARARLTAMGDLDPNVYDEQSAATAADGTQVATAAVTTDVPRQAFEPTLFDEPMVEALQRFQARHGLNLDGVIGPATLKQLNISPRTRAEQIAVNLERLRWMNRDLGERHILVNLAGFTMAVMNNGTPEFTSRVVVGKARKHQTPEFSETMTYMVVNPSWNVPRSIATKEILPKLRNDPSYLSRKGMRIVGADASSIDWSTVTAGTFPGRIVQRPGRGNALGTVKFMFPNRFAIYLHDTPSKRLFNRDVRAYSHGCVRVEKPHEFAAYLLNGQVDNPQGYFNALLKKRRERHVNLDSPLPVHLTYRSAWIDENGVEQFRGDVYGRDRKIGKALQNAGVSILQ